MDATHRTTRFVPAAVIAGARCCEEHGGYTCTLKRKHGPPLHEAHGPEGSFGAPAGQRPVLAEWPTQAQGVFHRRKPEKPFGFSTMDPARHREVAASGGRKAQRLGVAHKFTKEEARAAGRKGGAVVSQDREHMASIGRKGGLSVSADADHMSEIGGKGGSSVSDGPIGRAHMAEIGRKGGAARQRQKRGEA